MEGQEKTKDKQGLGTRAKARRDQNNGRGGWRPAHINVLCHIVPCQLSMQAASEVKKIVIPLSQEPVIVSGLNFRAMDITKLYGGMPLKTFAVDNKAIGDQLVTERQHVGLAADDNTQQRQVNQTQVSMQVEEVQFVQNPYTDADLGRMEAATRRNLCVRTSLLVLEMCVFYKESKLIIDLPELKKRGRKPSEVQTEIDNLTKQNAKILETIESRDQDLKLPQLFVKKLYWQNKIFGRGIIAKIWPKEEKEFSFKNIRRLKVYNSRRLGDPVLDSKNQMAFEGVLLDGKGLDRKAMIYATYTERDISPHTDHFGYSTTETIMHIAEAHNIATEEDVKEILKSGWMPTIGIKINTIGLSESAKKTRVETTINAINPGKVVGFSADDVIDDPIMIDLKPDYAGLTKMIQDLEAKIYKAFQVPQFLVQSESAANYATAKESAQIFLDGIVSYDQQWLTDLLTDQWYTPMLREELQGIKTAEQPDVIEGEETEVEQLPFIIKRVFEKPTIEEFEKLANALAALKQNNIWDVEQCNKKLGTPEVGERVVKQMEEDQKKFAQQAKEVGQVPGAAPTRKDALSGVKPATASIIEKQTWSNKVEEAAITAINEIKNAKKFALEMITNKVAQV